MARLWAVLAVVVSFLLVAPGDRVRDPEPHARLPGGGRRLRQRRRRRLVAFSPVRMRLAGTGPRPRRGWQTAGLLLGVIAGALWLSLGLGPAMAEAQERPPVQGGGVYRRPLGNDPATLDPARLRDIYSLAVGQQLFDGLVQFDQTLNITPALAQFWVASRDWLTWTFTLRKGVKFHHGREVTSDDVVYSFTRLLDPRLRSGGADHFMTIQGAPEFREGTRQAGRRPGRARSLHGARHADRGVGAVRLHPRGRPGEDRAAGAGRGAGGGVRAAAGRHGALPLRALGAREGDRPRGQSRLLRRTPEARRASCSGSSRASASTACSPSSRRGNLEDSPIPPKDYRQIIASQAYQYVRRPIFSLRHYGLNTRLKPLDDRRVRQALVYAIDREAIVSEVWLGRYALAKGILPPGTLGFNPKLKGYPHDPARGPRASRPGGLSRAGRACPPIAIWSSVRSEEMLREHERIRKDLEAVGVTAEFQYSPDWPSFSKAMSERKLPIFLRGVVRRRAGPRELPREAVPLRPARGTTWATRTRRWTASSTRRGPSRTCRAGSRSTAGPRSSSWTTPRDPRLAPDLRAAVPAVRQGRRGERPRRRVHPVPEGVARATRADRTAGCVDRSSSRSARSSSSAPC